MEGNIEKKVHETNWEGRKLIEIQENQNEERTEKEKVEK